MNTELYEPLKFYENTAKNLHNENTVAFFEKRLADSRVDVEENRKTVKEGLAEEALANKAKNKLAGKKTLKGFLIFFAVIGGIIAVVGLYHILENAFGLGAGLLLGGAALLVGMILLITKKINPQIKQAEDIHKEHREKAAALFEKAARQTAPLRALFTSADPLRLIEKTMPEFEFDLNFTKAQEDNFKSFHDFVELNGDDSSVINTLSGRFQENPFMYLRRRICEMGMETYRGTKVISWTETYRDSKGNLRTRHRTQTLTATITRPKPFYRSSTHLAYGSQAAPDLEFSREPHHWERLSEKQIEKEVRRGDRELQRIAEQALEDGRAFTEMANTEFEVLFDATNRTNETQFRLMYTPLGQTNTVDMLKSTVGYGDDIHFDKRRRFNIITTEHAQNRSMSRSPKNYYSHDVDEIREKFISFNNEYFKSLYFDFIPLFCVPAYLDEPARSFEPPEDYSVNYTGYEHEVMANALGDDRLHHIDSDTEAILKAGSVQKNGARDNVQITAHSFRTIPRVEYVSVFGGDGNFHQVPVHWREYIPVERTSTVAITQDERAFHGLAIEYVG